MLEIRHLTKQYGEKTAVEDLTLTIRPGEIFGFIGPNGAGKTTTLKCCCGILQPDRGEVWVNGCSMRTTRLRPSVSWPICRMTRPFMAT